MSAAPEAAEPPSRRTQPEFTEELALTMDMVSGAYTSADDVSVTLEQQRVRVLELRSLDRSLRSRVRDAAELLERELVMMLDPHWRRDDADADEYVLQAVRPEPETPRSGSTEAGQRARGPRGERRAHNGGAKLEWESPTPLTVQEARMLGPPPPPSALQRLLLPVTPLVEPAHIARAALEHRMRRERVLKLGYDTLAAARAAPEAAVMAAAAAHALSSSRQRAGGVRGDAGVLAAEPDTAALMLLASPLQFRVGNSVSVENAASAPAPRNGHAEQSSAAVLAVRRAQALIRRVEGEAELELRKHTHCRSLGDAEALLAARSTGKAVLDPTEALAASLALTVVVERHKLASSARWLTADAAPARG